MEYALHWSYLQFFVRKYHKIKEILEIEEKINVGRVLELADSCV